MTQTRWTACVKTYTPRWTDTLRLTNSLSLTLTLPFSPFLTYTLTLSQDCEDGSDEVDCRDYSLGFSKSVNQKLTGREVEKWLYTLKTTCAARCVQAKNFVCMSFNYQ